MISSFQIIFVSLFTYHLIIHFYKYIKYCQRQKLKHISIKTGLIRWFVRCLFIHAFPTGVLEMVHGILSRQRRGLCRHYRGRTFTRKKPISQVTCGCPCQVICLLGKLHKSYALWWKNITI